MTPSPTPQLRPPNARPRRDWFGLALTMAAIVVGILTLGLIVRAVFVPPVMRTLAESYTTTRPAWTPDSPLTETERETLERKVDAFVETVKDEEVIEVQTLELTQDDLNALLEDEWQNSAGDWKLTVKVIDGVVSGLLSLRIGDDLAKGLWAPFRGRFVNADCTFDLALRDNALHFQVDTCTVKGRSVPGFVVNRLNAELRDALDDQDARAFAENLTHLTVYDDRIILSAEPPPAGA